MSHKASDQKKEPLLLPGWQRVTVSGLLEHCLADEPEEMAALPMVKTLGDYELGEEIGRGGMGVVYRAQQKSLRRPVAVKLLLGGEFARRDYSQRFKNEAQLLAKLRHPHLVSIYEVGEEDGLAYYAMELVEGQSLEAGWGEQDVDGKARAHFLSLVARAVHYAHQQGVIHRDLKPSNILRDASGEPRVSDFGLARLMTPDEDTPSLTRSLDVLGSPPYMPPEQVKGETKTLGPTADVYALGGVLYFLLTGRAPFQSASLPQLITQVVEATPVSPRQLDPTVPLDLETITLKCLEKDPARRYQSAAELAEELERYKKGEPILARPLGPLARAWRWARLRPSWAALLSLSVLAVLFGLLGTLWQWRRAALAYDQQVKARAAEAQVRQGLEDHNYASDLRAASLAILDQQQLEIGRQLLARHENYAQKGIEWYLLREKARSQELAHFSHETPAAVVALALDEPRRRLASGDEQGRVYLWDLEKKQRHQLLLPAQQSAVLTLDFTPEGHLLIGTKHSQVSLWDLERPTAAIAIYPGVTASLSADGKVLATAEGDAMSWVRNPGPVRVWSPLTASEPWTLPEDGQWVAVSPDGRVLAVAHPDDGVVLWDIAQRKKLATRLTGSGRVWRPTFSADGRKLAVAGRGSAWWWTLPDVFAAEPGEEKNIAATYLPHPLDVWAVRFLSPEAGGQLITACGDRVVRSWDVGPLARREPRFSLAGNPEEVWSLALTKDGREIITGLKSGTVHLWPGEITIPQLFVTSHNYEQPIFSHDGRLLVTTINDKTQPNVIYDLSETHAHLRTKIPLRGQIIGASHRHSQAFWVRHYQTDGILRIQEAELKEQATLAFLGPAYPQPESRITHSGFAKDSSAFFSVSTNKVVTVCRTSDGQTLGIFQLHLPNLCRPALSPGGKYFAVGGIADDGPLVLVEVASGQQKRLLGHRYSVNAVAFSPDGSQLASVASDAMLKIWDCATGEENFSTLAHLVQASCVDWSADGRTIATISEGEGFKLWHVRTRREVLFWPLHEAGRHITFSPDGRWLAIARFADSSQAYGPLWLLPIPRD